jgi:hypothetical protein
MRQKHLCNTEGENMRLSIRLLRARYVLKIFFPPERYIKWLPAVMWAKVGPAKTMEKQA